MILLDTNTVVHYINGNSGVIAKIQSSSPGSLAVPSVVLYELECGSLRSKSTKRRALIKHVVQELEIIPFDGAAALEAAKIQTELSATGTLIGPMDTLIAGIARHHAATLVTNNVKEFSRVKGLRIEDWRTED